MSRLSNLDLNLLVFLRELLGERNVTRAAQRIGVTQPAASAALRRLRAHFGDELLTRTPGGYELTSLGRALASQVEPVHIAVERLFSTTGDFDPLTTDREFSLHCADYVALLLAEPLSRRMAAQAPHAGLHLTLVGETMTGYMTRAVRMFDTTVAPPVHRLRVPEVRSERLFEDEWVCIVSAENEKIGATPTVEELAALPWVLPYHPDGSILSVAHASRLLSQAGMRPHIAARVDSYAFCPAMVVGTDRVTLLQRRLADRLAGPGSGLVVRPWPGPTEPVVEVLWWHERLDGDDAHRWFRRLVREAAASLPVGGATGPQS